VRAGALYPQDRQVFAQDIVWVMTPHSHRHSPLAVTHGGGGDRRPLRQQTRQLQQTNDFRNHGTLQCLSREWDMNCGEASGLVTEIDDFSITFSPTQKRDIKSTGAVFACARHPAQLLRLQPDAQAMWRGIKEDARQPTSGDAEKSPVKVRKLRVFPTKQQKEKLKQWFGAARWTYNKCVEVQRSGALRGKSKTETAKLLRSRFLKKEVLNGDKAWLQAIPFDVRDEALRDCLKAIQRTLAKPEVRHFEMKFRSLKDESQSIGLRKKHWNKKRGVFSDVFSVQNLRCEQELPEKLDHDCRFVRTRLGHYYLCMPVDVKSSDSQAPLASQHSTISLDPGVRTFMTGFDADGLCCEWGKDDMTKIFRLCHSVDSLQRRWKGVRHHQRYRMKIAARRVRLKIRNLVDEMHKKLAKWLCENYRCVIIPEFEPSQMVIKGNRKVNSKTASAMLTWSHYRFRQRLLNKAREYSTCQVIVADEAYTSKTGAVERSMPSSAAQRRSSAVNVDTRRIATPTEPETFC